MTKVKKNEGYDIYEHVHRFAAWAAARAASTKGQRFKVKKGKELIEAARLKDYLNGKKSLPDNPKGMDKIHRMWRKSVRSAADERGFVISHGVAAKLINVYFKAGLVTIANCNQQIGALHPPIDRELLKSLRKSDEKSGEKSDQERAIFWRSKEVNGAGWSNFSSDEYEEVIGMIRKKLGSEKQLWMIEKYWQGYQG